MMMSSDLSLYTKLQALRSAPANSTTTEASSSTAPAQVLQHPPKKFRRLMTDFESRNRMASDETGAVLSSLHAELEQYSTEIGHCAQLCDSGLAFWQDKHRQNSFAILAPLALDLVAAPASQAYVERVFSVCGDMSAGKRNRLSRNLERRVFLRMNKQYLTNTNVLQ